MLGRILADRYRLTGLLGKGGMGSVYEARDIVDDRSVAVKVVDVSDVPAQRTAARRFRREAKAAMALDTPHIVRGLSSGEEAGLLFFVMEHLAGEDLRGLFRRCDPLRPDLALRIAAQICLGLQAAHEAGIVHRDIKPANLFLERGSGGEITVKILDFGIAKLEQGQISTQDTSRLTSTGNVLGTPHYMAPEQARGSRAIDHRADLWSLGIVLYRCLSGRVPHHGVDRVGDLVMAICTEPPGSVQEVAPWVPAEVAAVVHRALRMNPADRFQSAAEMLDAIRPLLAGDFSLHEEMITPLTEAERAVVAPPLEVTTQVRRVTRPRIADPDSEAPTLVHPDSEAPTLLHPARSPAPSPPPPPRGEGEATRLMIQAISRGRARGRAYLAAAALLAVLCGVVLIRRMDAPGAAAVPVSSPPPVASSVPVVPVATRTWKLQVTPGDASVEVEGAPARVADGGVMITGTLGSVHRVRVSQGAREASAEVVVTEAGLLPSRIELLRARPDAVASEAGGSRGAPASGGPGRAKAHEAGP